MHGTMSWTQLETGEFTADPSQEFWTAWRTDKSTVKLNGYRVAKEPTGWKVYYKEVKMETSPSRALTSDLDVPVPEGLSYFGYQKAGVEFIHDRDALLADSPGLGKSIMTAGAINMNPDYQKILIICPNSIKINWKRELEKWLVQHYTIGVVNRGDYPEGTDIVIINYDMVDKHKDKLHSVEWDLMVLDESHAIKNRNTKRTKAILGKGKRVKGIPAKRKLFLTGTPILNRPIELFTTLNALDPENWDSEWKYAHRYCGAVNNGWGWDFTGASNLAELNQKLRSTIMVRRSKEEALPELPPVFHQIIELPQTAALRRLLREEAEAWETKDEVLSDLRAAVEIAKVSENDSEYKQAVKDLQKGMSSSFEEMSRIRQEIAIAKIPYVVEHVQDVEGKTIIFFHHKEVGRQLKEKLGDEAVMLVGDTKMEDRQEAVDRFQTDPNIKYFLGSITAAGVGITLTESSNVVFVELDYRPAMINQAYSRAQRLGQKNNVLVQYLLVEGSIDVKMAQDIIDKQEIIDQVLDNEVDDEIVVEVEASVKLPPRSKIKVESFTDEEKSELMNKLRILAALDQDRAQVANNLGFSKVDSKIGHSLAGQERLTDRQAMLAQRMVTKYRRQLE